MQLARACDEFVAERWVGERNQPHRPFIRGFSAQVAQAVLGHDEMRLDARVRRRTLQRGHDARGLAVGRGGRRHDEGQSALRVVGAMDEVELAARCAELSSYVAIWVISPPTSVWYLSILIPILSIPP